MQATSLGQKSAAPNEQGEQGKSLLIVTTRGPLGIHSVIAWLAAKMHRVHTPRDAAKCPIPELFPTT